MGYIKYINLRNKHIALFGLGDQIGYPNGSKMPWDTYGIGLFVLEHLLEVNGQTLAMTLSNQGSQ